MYPDLTSHDEILLTIGYEIFYFFPIIRLLLANISNLAVRLSTEKNIWVSNFSPQLNQYLLDVIKENWRDVYCLAIFQSVYTK